MKFNIPSEVRFIIETLQVAGHKAYLVGGSVRDFLLHKTPKDYDITTSALPAKVKEIFAGNKAVHIYDTGIKYGTVTVVFGDYSVEVTTYRTDGTYKDGRRPEIVEFGNTLAEDVTRRDFTINGVAYDGEKIVDYVGGQVDISMRLVRSICNPEYRFQEDALRMMRAVRFACTLDFEIEKDTEEAILCCAHLIENVSAERIRDELCKILVSNHPGRGIMLLHRTGLLYHVLLDIYKLHGFEQRSPRHTKDVFDHTLMVLEATPPILEVRLAALLHDVGKPDTFTMDEKGIGHFYGHHTVGAEIAECILRHLKFDNNMVETVTTLVREHMGRHEHMRPKSIKRFINRVGVERFPLIIHLIYADIIGHAPPYDFLGVIELALEYKRLLEYKEPMKVSDLAVNGHDLIAVGYEPGPALGKALNRLREHVLDFPHDNCKEILLELLLEETTYANFRQDAAVC